MTTRELLCAARASRRAIGAASGEVKNAALLRMADELAAAETEILAANASDMEAAAGKLSESMLDRLRLDSKRLAGMADGIRQVSRLPDPVGIAREDRTLPNGLRLRRVTSPMGVIAIIYESRPNVTSDAAALAIKAGSACVLRCGKEAHRSAAAIVAAMRRGLAKAGLPEDALVLIEDVTRASAAELMTARGLVDLLIPRGGKGLISAVVTSATVPVIETGTGICHIFVENSADPDEALKILENAKCSRPSVCNACEVCLVDRGIAKTFLPRLAERLTADRARRGLPQVELRLDAEAAKIIPGKAAGETDFDTEFLDYILAVKVVDGVDAAAEHIALHSTGHSEAILTRNEAAAEAFTARVDSAAVYVNASTRFTDGGEFGLGCEMGISTQKLHARGPMGLEALVTSRYIVTGNGQIR